MNGLLSFDQLTTQPERLTEQYWVRPCIAVEMMLLKPHSMPWRLVLLVTLSAGAVRAAPPDVAPGLWQITVIDFAARTNVTQECIKTSEWAWWIVLAGKITSEETCMPPVTTMAKSVVKISQACQSVSAEMEISSAGAERLSGNLVTLTVTPYGMAIPFHSKFEARRLSADCP